DDKIAPIKYQTMNQGYIQLIYDTCVEKIALPPGARWPADCGRPCASFAAACCCRSGKNIRRSRLALGSLWAPHCPGEPRLRLRPKIFGFRKTTYCSRIVSAFRPDHARSDVEPATHSGEFLPLHLLGGISATCAESKRDCCLLSLQQFRMA